MSQITKKTGSVKNADVAMPDEGSAQYDALMEETGGAAASDGFNLAAHIAATSGADAVEDDDETDDPSDDPVIDPVNEQDDESADEYDSRFDSEEDAIRYAEETIQGPLTRDDDGTLVNQYGEVMVYDSDGNLVPKPRDPIALDDQAPFSGADDQLEDSRAPEFNVELPAVGSAEYEALMFETGGAAANDGFNYQAHLAATGQLDKLVELDPDYDPELDPVFDDGFEPPFDSSSPEAGIDRGGLVGAATFEEFLEQTNGVDVGALGAYLTPEEITQVLDRFGGDPEFEAYVGGPVAPPAGAPRFPSDPGFIAPPPAYIPPEEQLGAIRGGDREGQKAAVLELFADAGDFDAFASGLAASLTPGEIDALIADLAAEEDLWATLGMDMPVMPAPGLGEGEFDSRFDDVNDAIAFAETNGQGQLTVADDGTITNQFGEVMVYDSDGNLAPGGNPNVDFSPGFPGEFAPGFPGDPGFIAPPPAYIPPEEQLGAIRGGDREGQKAAVLELYADAGDFDAFASGLAASLTPGEIDALIADLAAEEDLWATLGMDMPVMPAANVESPAGTESNISMNIPDFVPRDEDLSVIRTADKETKKDAIFDLLDESGTVDAFLSGLAGSLEPEEISSLAFEFADDADIWDALGIPQPQLPLEEVVVETSSEADIPFDSSVDGAEPDLGLIGLDPTTSV